MITILSHEQLPHSFGQILFPPSFFLEDGFLATFDVTSLPVETLEFS